MNNERRLWAVVLLDAIAIILRPVRDHAGWRKVWEDTWAWMMWRQDGNFFKVQSFPWVCAVLDLDADFVRITVRNKFFTGESLAGIGHIVEASHPTRKPFHHFPHPTGVDSNILREVDDGQN